MPKENEFEGVHQHGVPAPLSVKIRQFGPKGSNSCAKFMKLSHTTEQLNLYCELVEFVAKLYDLHEDWMRTVKPKSAEWRAFEKMVEGKHPFLIHSYHNAWPVTRIVREHRRRKYDHRRGKTSGLSDWTKYKVPIQQAAHRCARSDEP